MVTPRTPGTMWTEDEMYVLVHADGGNCHGTPLIRRECPVCHIHPDMQSTEFWTPEQVEEQRQINARYFDE